MDCPECGAPAGECETRYHECLAKEFSEPGYGAVHHLTVLHSHNAMGVPPGYLHVVRYHDNSKLLFVQLSE